MQQTRKAINAQKLFVVLGLACLSMATSTVQVFGMENGTDGSGSETVVSTLESAEVLAHYSGPEHLIYADGNATRPSFGDNRIKLSPELKSLLRREILLSDDNSGARLGVNVKGRPGRLNSVMVEYRVNF